MKQNFQSLRALSVFLSAVLPLRSRADYTEAATLLCSNKGRVLAMAFFVVCLQVTQFPNKELLAVILLAGAVLPNGRSLIWGLGSLLVLPFPSKHIAQQINVLSGHFEVTDLYAIKMSLLSGGGMALLLSSAQFRFAHRLWAERRLSPAVVALSAAGLFSLFLVLLTAASPVGLLGFSLWVFSLYYLFPLLVLCARLLQPGTAAMMDSVAAIAYTYRPFWNTGGYFPFLHGAMGEVAARDSGQSGVLLLKGTRLLLWAICIIQFREVLIWIMRESSIPDFHVALEIAGNRGLLSVGTAWLAAGANFLHMIFYFTVNGHVMVSIGRVIGLDLKRHTYKPFAADSILSFFQRTTYYYVELLRVLIFYPVLFATSKFSVPVRVVLAVVFSAGIGNFLITFFKDAALIAVRGVGGALSAYAPYMVFCATLTFFILVSFSLRNVGIAGGKLSFILNLLNRGSVLLFYILLFIFHDLYVGDLSANWAFFLALFGHR